MTTSDWPQADPGLERAYRRLLRAYPRGYRRRHEQEIMTTLLEMAEPGQRRPGRSEVWHLVASGVRQRFRLPAGRPLAWVFAVFALVAGGAVGAAAGSWAAERTFTDLPDRAAVQALVDGLVPARTDRSVVSGDGGSPWFGAMVAARAPVAGLGGWDARQARRQLIGDGWQVGVIAESGGVSVAPAREGRTVTVAAGGSEFRAERGGVTMLVMGWLTERGGHVGVQMWPTGNASLLPLVTAGGLAGAVAGWLVAAAAARALSRAGAVQRWSGGLLAAAAVAVAALPVAALHANLVGTVRHAGHGDPVFTVHSALSPWLYWPFGPGWLNPALLAAGAVLAGGALVVAAMRPVPAGAPAAAS